jgi:hypothetical protein
MIQDAEFTRQLAHQRERELIAEANRERLAKSARDERRGRSPDRKGR